MCSCTCRYEGCSCTDERRRFGPGPSESSAARSKMSVSPKKIVFLPGESDPDRTIPRLRRHMKEIACVAPYRYNPVQCPQCDVFAGCIPLKHLFGFCEDYKKILLNCNQQLILNRSSTDLDAIRVVGAGATEHVEKNKKITIELTKVAWKMPIIKVTDKEKLKLLKVLDSRKTLSCAFRTWDLCEYPVHLNSEVFPYEDFRADIKKNTTSLLYKAYTDFQKSYYERDYCEPLLSKNVFQTYVPIVVVDLSHQNDNVKSSTIDLRIEFETDTVIPEKTAAYCLILHDQIITYNPFSGD
ncbi:hypothetical protein AGLY_018354, partial [Aphis glycines]